MDQIINKKRFFPPFFIVALFFIFQLFSIMQFVRYAHGFFGTLGYILISGLLSYLIFIFRNKPWIAKFFDSPIPFIIFLILLVAAALIIYPKVDALKLVNKGSDQDDGVIIATTRMLSGLYPYSENTYVGNPISIGPGWLILHTPFVAIHLYILASVFFIALNGILIVYLTGHYRGVTLMSFLLASSLLFWERFVTGTDMLTMGAVSASAVSLFFISKLLKRRWIIMCGIILAVLVCSSRIPLVYLSVVFGGIGLVFGKKRGILIGVVILSGALLLLLLFYLWQPESYSILHVITKAYRLLHSWGMLVNAAVSIFCIYLAIVHFYKTRNLSNAYLALAIAWLIPFGVMSIADIIYRNWDWRMWEGSNYFLPAIMALATWGAIRSCGSSQIVLR